ncbi:MAG: alpha/beta hydrolase [Kangiellaceae bacterium]|nr:alpha/beta hydrolase [Kangiellaceae bacterium]
MVVFILMQEQAIFVENRKGEQLFGFQHEPKQTRLTCVVFCHPFGEEKHRSYRAFYSFSTYLAKNNISSFRFDMKGAGDSDGELCESTIESQVEDTQDAISYFLKHSSATSVVLIGLRLGATIAALTAERDQRVCGLALLSPVYKGASYWRELLRTKQFAAIALKQKATKSSVLMKQLEDSGQLEIEAQLISFEFVNQLKAIDISIFLAKCNIPVLVTGLARDSIGKDVSNKLIEARSNKHQRTEIWHEEARDYWSILSLYDQYYPEATFERTLAWLTNETIDH